MRTYAYIRVEPNAIVDIDEFQYFFKKNGYEIPRNRLVYEEVAINTSIAYRDKIMNLINFRLEEGDTIVLKGIDCLGSNFTEVLQTMNLIDMRKLSLICLDYSSIEIKGDLKKIFIHFLKMVLIFENKIINNGSILNKDKNYKKVGRPEILNEIQKNEVLDKYKKGSTVYSLAKEYSVTRTVIQRILRKNLNKIS